MAANLSPSPSFPVISPTGALSSGDYTAYMITYNQLLCNYIANELGGVYSQDVINDWGKMWDRIIGDINSQVTELTDRSNKINAKLLMISNILGV